MIASLLNTGKVALFKYNDDADNQSSFQTLSGLEEEGFGLSWNPLQKGLLAGASGREICLWDVNNIQ